MDYDDNDFQGQSLHLAGEASSKLSPVLHPYALPKFDFDDGLQGHLKFDSLVDNEIFLGIPSQEDNHWIEDFSRGSRGIDFNSSAAESCSISRRNNVWSEATSSESVEMLLKSVGQEEIVHGKTIVEDSEACHEEQMEPHVKHDENVENVSDSDPSLRTDELPEHLSRLNDVQGTSQTLKAEISICASSHRLDPNASRETLDVLTDYNPGVSSKHDNENYIGVGSSAIESPDNSVQKDSSVEVLNNQESENHVGDLSFKNAPCLSTDACDPMGEDCVLNKEVDKNSPILEGIAFRTVSHNLVNLPCSSSMVEAIKQHTVETGSSSFEKPSSFPLKGDCTIQIVGRCDGDSSSADPDKCSNSEPVVVSNSQVIHQQFRRNMPEDSPIVCQTDSDFEGHAIEGNMNGGISAGLESEICLTTQVENSSVEGKYHLLESHRQLDGETPVCNFEASLLSGMDNKVSDGQGNVSSRNSNYFGNHSGLTVSCSTEYLEGQPIIENSNGVDSDSVVQKEDLNAEDHVSSPMVAGSVQTYNSNLVSNANEVHHDQDVAFNEKEKAKLPNYPSKMECQILESLSSGRRVESSSQGEGMKVNNWVALGSEYDITCRNGPALNVALGNTNLASQDTLDGVPVLSVTDATEDQVMNQLVKQKKTDDEDSTEGNLLSLKESAERENKGPVLEIEECASHASTVELLHEAVDQELPHKAIGQSLPIAEANSIASKREHLVKGNETSESSCNKLEVWPNLCDSVVKHDGGAGGVVVPGNQAAAAVVKEHEMASSKVEGASVDSDKPKCGMPTVISCTLVSPSEKDKEEGLKVSPSRSVLFSEISVRSTSQNVSRNDVTFEVHPSTGQSEKETSNDVQSLPTIQPCKISKVVKGSPSARGVGQMDLKPVTKLSCGSSQTPDEEIARGGSKGTAERKTRRASTKATGKETANKGKGKETTPSRQLGSGDKFEGLKPFGNVEHNATIPCCVVSTPTTNLLVLSTSASPTVLFKQPFTDLQQVQLRAQILVYGSLIQGAAPDEACMNSAFGASDDGRSAWEPVWRACVETFQNQKSHSNKSVDPVQSCSGASPPDQLVKQGTLQSKVLLSPVGQASSKVIPSPVVNSMIPVSTPLWNIATPSCDGLQPSGMPRSGLLDYHKKLSPLHPFQTQSTQSFIGHNHSWLSQGPFPGPWVASPHTSVFDASARFSGLPMTEAVKLTPVKESFAPFPSGTSRASHCTVVHGTGSSVFVGTPSLPDREKVIVSSGQNPTDPKARKKKKVTVSEDLSKIPLLVQTQTEAVYVPLVTSHMSTSVVVSTPACFVSRLNASKVVTALSPTLETDHTKRGEEHIVDQKAKLSDDTYSKVEEARRQAEDAAALAAAAVSQSQNVWSQLYKQRSSGLVPDVEAKLASAAVAIAAAASVAKAAAAAANLASSAALQAKLMADEALISSANSNPAQSNAASLFGVMNLGNATPASILKGGDGSNSSSSIIIAAREAARRMVEAASAASKHAENLDAIVKAAELAAEAVSQAGKIVGMGDPLPLNELLEAGPEGSWRVPQVPHEPDVKMNKGDRERSRVDSIEGHNVSGKHARDGPLEVANTTSSILSPLPQEVSMESLEDHTRTRDHISSSFTSSDKDLGGQWNRKASDLAKTIGVIPESEIGSSSDPITAQAEYEKGVGILKENNIKEGFLVEVHKDGDTFKAAWYSANVLSVKDGKAFVVYLDIQSDNGSGQLKEWVALEGAGNSAPRIRIDRRVATLRSEGTRKRRRAARGDYVWSVGDRVDAWIKDSWREGVVTEMNDKDDTSLTVHFPAEGERSVVRVWHLRPTLIWKDGEWIDWSSSGEKDPSSQGNVRQQKRLKLGRPAIEGGEKDNICQSIELGQFGKPAESRLLPLSANDEIFKVGKNAGDENKSVALRTARSGLQKEGSRVIFGVPKPGKKRKFMEVSKHYVAEKSRKTEPKDSIKLANYLMPQGSGFRGWKNSKNDAIDKQPTESKPKALKSGKQRSVLSRSLSQKDKLLTSALSAQNEGTGKDHMAKYSVLTDKNESGQHKLMEFGSVSNTETASEGPLIFSSQALPLVAHSKKITKSNARSEQVNRGKPATSTGKLFKVEVEDKLNGGNSGKSIPEDVEPRRSNRRIQPTSRLLEGLQSSLMVSKIPAVSYDKRHRSQNRGSSKGNNHG